MTKLPVTLLGGYLGAGKTTLVNALLRRAAGRRLAVLVNEFGALPIDADLIAARQDDLLTIAGGCICCSYGSDLVGALLDLVDRRVRLDHLIIETSGVALPDAVAQALTLVPGLARDGIVVLADAETLPARAADRYLADTILRQIAAADLVVLTKTDLLEPLARAGRRAWLAERWPAARVVEAVRGDLPVDLVLGPRGGAASPEGGAAAPLHAPGYVSCVIQVLAPVAPRAFAAALAAATPQLLRAKGFVTDATGVAHAIQIVGHRHDSVASATAPLVRDMLVCIGMPGLETQALVDALTVLVPVRVRAASGSARWPIGRDRISPAAGSALDCDP